MRSKTLNSPLKMPKSLDVYRAHADTSTGRY